MAICEDRYGPDSLWLHLIDPDASHPALSGSFESADADAIQLCMDMVPLVGSAILNYLTAFYWQLRLFQSSVHFKATLQGQAFRKLVAMRRPFLRNSVQGTSWRALRQMSMVWADMAGYGWWCSVWRWLVCLYYSDHVFHFLAINLDFFIPMIFLIVSTYFWVESRRIMLSKTGKQSLSWMMKSWSPSKGFGSWGPIVNGTSRSNSFRRKQPVYPKQGTKLFLSNILFALSPVVYWILDNLVLLFGGQSLASGQLSLGKLLALQLYLVF